MFLCDGDTVVQYDHVNITEIGGFWPDGDDVATCARKHDHSHTPPPRFWTESVRVWTAEHRSFCFAAVTGAAALQLIYPDNPK